MPTKHLYVCSVIWTSEKTTYKRKEVSQTGFVLATYRSWMWRPANWAIDSHGSKADRREQYCRSSIAPLETHISDMLIGGPKALTCWKSRNAISAELFWGHIHSQKYEDSPHMFRFVFTILFFPRVPDLTLFMYKHLVLELFWCPSKGFMPRAD